MKRIIFLTLLGVNLFSGVHAQATNENSNRTSIQVPGKLMGAYNIAYAEFTKNNFRLNNFLINISDLGEWVEVSFVPIPKPYETGIRGGRNSSGKEIHYAVSLSDLKILRVWYGR
jgi:hypothetical protein